MRVAVLGTGAMGGAMARRLHDAGHDVTVWNRTRARAAGLVEAVPALTLADTPAAATADADVVITMLSDGPAVEAVVLGADGLLEGIGEGSVVLEMSTVEPERSQGLAPLLRERGSDLLDAPVSGSVPIVERGALTIMVGGEERSLERARPVFDALAARVVRMGPVGTGAAMKLAVNAVIHGLNQALAEGLVLAEAAGIDRSLAYEVIASGAAGAPFVDYKRGAYTDPDRAAVAFRLTLVHKDLELILDLADRLGVPMPQGRTNRDVAAAAAVTHGERDMSALAVHLREQRAEPT